MDVRRAAAPASLVLVLAAALAGCGGGGGGSGPSGGCTLPGAAALTVAEATPAQGATNVSVNAAVVLRFNTCLDAATLRDAVLVTRGTTLVAVTPAYDAATATLTLAPDAPLAWGATYLVATLPSLRGARGEAHAGWGGSFRTRAAPDTVPPTTTASLPAGRYDHALEVDLTCTDDAAGTGCAATHYTVDGAEPGAGSPRYDGPIAIASTTTLRFRSADVDGNWEAPRAVAYVIDTDPPGVVSVSPAHGATGVPVDVVVTVAFDEEMRAADLYSERLAVTPRETALAHPAAGGRSVAVRFTRPLECGTTYAFAYGTPRDLAGNALPAPLAFSFTTTSDCTPPTTAASLEDGVYPAPREVTLTCSDGTGDGCARIVYTTDGSVPAVATGTVVEGAAAGPIALPEGETVLRFFSVDRAGHREAMREERYAVSASGFTYVATGGGIARGAGPVPARFTTLPAFGWTYAFHRDRTTGRLWRATERGVAFSDDGATWTPGAQLKDSYGWMLPASSVWAEGPFVLAGTREGLYASHDGGFTWAVMLSRTSGYDEAQVLDVDGEGKDLLVATSLGLAVSHDRGRSFGWRGSAVFRDVDLDPETGEVWAASSTGLLRSTDRGATFTTHDATSTPALPSAAVNAVAATATHVHLGTEAGYVRLARDGSGAPAAAAVLANPCPRGDANVLEVAVSGARVFLATGSPWSSGSTDAFCVSANGGTSFAPGWFVAPDRTTAIASTIHAEGSDVWVGYSPSFFRSTDGGATFDLGDLPTVADDVVASGGKLFAATGYGVAVSTDGFRTFTTRTARDGLRDPDVVDLAVGGGGVLYAASGWGLSISRDGGATFAVPSQTLLNTPDCVAADGALAFVCGDTVLYRSLDAGATWQQRLPVAGGPTLYTRGVAVRGQTVALASGSGVWISSDGGGTFAQRGEAAGIVPAGGYLTLYAAAVAPSGDVWIGANGGGFVSRDGGATFARPAGIPPSVWIEAVTAEPGAPLYLGTSDGLAISTDGGVTFTWRRAAEGIGGPRTAAYVP
jgi:hypothetical protein